MCGQSYDQPPYTDERDPIRPGAVCPVCGDGLLKADDDDPRLTVCASCGAVPTGIEADR